MFNIDGSAVGARRGLVISYANTRCLLGSGHKIVCACACACVRACVRACVCVSVSVYPSVSIFKYLFKYLIHHVIFYYDDNKTIQ